MTNVNEMIKFVATLLSGGMMFYFLQKYEQVCLEFVKELRNKYPDQWQDAGRLTEKDIRIGKAYRLRKFINKNRNNHDFIKWTESIKTFYRAYLIAGLFFFISAVIYIFFRE